MKNEETQAAWTYHIGTSYPNGTMYDETREYDNSMRPPSLFKAYTDIAPNPLPLDVTPAGMPALEAIAVLSSDGDKGDIAQNIDLGLVARLFYFAAGITKQIAYKPTGIVIPFRAAACTGALYHIELYLVCGDLPGLPAGVYHLDAQGPSIRELRRGDFRSVLIEASGHETRVAHAPAIFVATDVIGRNAIKYQTRAYRHSFWDGGTILANLLAAAATQHVPAQVVVGFVDAQVNHLLGLDTQREFAQALIPIGASRHANEAPLPEAPALNLAVQPFTSHDTHYPAILEMHESSSLRAPADVAAWRKNTPSLKPARGGSLIPLRTPAAGEMPAAALENVIHRRGSPREFARIPIDFSQLSIVLRQSLQGVPADFITSPGSSLNEVYLTIHAVEGLEPGAYVLRRDRWALEPLKQGDLREASFHLGLDQELAGDASANLFFLADLPPILAQWGNRGYRVAQLDAAIAAGRAYLAAHALGFGATGLTFFDDDVIEFFSPDAAGKSVMFLCALGHRKKRTG